MKTIKYLSYIVLGAFVLTMSSCEPKALTDKDVLVDADNVTALTKDGKVYNINTLLDTYMTEEGNFKSDSSLYRTRAKFGNLYLFSIDTLPVEGPGIYIRGRVATDDYGGNYYKSLVIQQVNDWEADGYPTIDQQCLRISLDLGSASGLYHQGQEILIRCNGMAIGRYANQPQLCVPSYNNNIYASSAGEKVGWAPGRIPSAQFRNAAHLIGLPDVSKLVYDNVDLATLKANYLSKFAQVVDCRKIDGRLVKVVNVHFNGKYEALNSGPTPCTIYKADGSDTGNPELDEYASTFGPTTGNVGFPQSRYVEDGANTLLVGTSEYARYAYYYLPAAKYVGSVTGILGYYMDNGGYAAKQSNWSITPCNIWDILPECQADDADPKWTPVEWKAGVPQPTE